MIIFYGQYYVGGKRVACRNDFCETCQKETLTVQIRRFCFGHIFWLPIIPLGFRRHWQCKECGDDPRGRVTKQRIVNIVGAAFLLFVSLMVWLNPGEVKDDADMAVNWIIRYVLPIGALYLLYSTFKETPESETSRECRKSVSR